MRPGWQLASVLTVAGCFSPAPQVGLPCTSGGDCPLGQRCSPAGTCERSFADASTGALPIARYLFEGDLTDDVATHDGTQVGTVGFVPGRAGAGMALHVPPGGASWVRVPDALAFDLDAGRIELWFAVGSAAPVDTQLGLISRDASQTMFGGHVGIRVAADRTVVARIQRMSDPTVEAHRCTSTTVDLGWHHVELEFGPGGLALRLDGADATGTSWVDPNGDSYDCTTPWSEGIAGNDNPWVIGGLTLSSVEGTGAPVTSVAEDVAIDDVAIWAAP